MSAVNRDAYTFLFGYGLEYYIAGRAAAIAQQSRVAGNVLHHAVEMILKGELSKTLPLKTLKDKYGHRLDEAWNALKQVHPDKELGAFDKLISELDRFEDLRYPDKVLMGATGRPLGQCWMLAARSEI